jgi:hypothetical protein
VPPSCYKTIDLNYYKVTVTFGERVWYEPVVWGPFKTIGNAEQCVLIMAARDDVQQAVIGVADAPETSGEILESLLVPRECEV